MGQPQPIALSAKIGRDLADEADRTKRAGEAKSASRSIGGNFRRFERSALAFDGAPDFACREKHAPHLCVAEHSASALSKLQEASSKVRGIASALIEVPSHRHELDKANMKFAG